MRKKKNPPVIYGGGMKISAGFFRENLDKRKYKRSGDKLQCKIYHILISMVLWEAINSPGSTNKDLTWPAQDPWKETNVFVLEEVR